MTNYRVILTITDEDRPDWLVQGEGEVQDLEFNFRPGSQVSWTWPDPDEFLQQQYAAAFGTDPLPDPGIRQHR